ncbi:hypothetical protein SAMN02745121_05758 [Nannocystis exedens]|uniref:Uncharacterized protein n=1 Tax=Nannocystis exedens TaxID=54 RepID=A0A1I2DT57_9BACT|nr:hypothetical protein NAEX_01929 [Nannocystis exedens]SFE83822.1 hypothetical protein SAMN02745121_05758 [Nannocystis exedens]
MSDFVSPTSTSGCYGRPWAPTSRAPLPRCHSRWTNIHGRRRRALDAHRSQPWGARGFTSLRERAAAHGSAPERPSLERPGPAPRRVRGAHQSWSPGAHTCQPWNSPASPRLRAGTQVGPAAGDAGAAAHKLQGRGSQSAGAADTTGPRLSSRRGPRAAADDCIDMSQRLFLWHRRIALVPLRGRSPQSRAHPPTHDSSPSADAGRRFAAAKRASCVRVGDAPRPAYLPCHPSTGLDGGSYDLHHLSRTVVRDISRGSMARWGSGHA